MNEKTENLGLGVMIQMLGGNEESALTMKKAIGKTISALALKDDALHFTFTDETGIKLFDDGQSCCEHRYMTTDDDLAYYIGSVLQNAEVRPGGSLHADYNEHDSEFLIITTSKGAFTMVNHNEHNGYYGGFAVRCAKIS